MSKFVEASVLHLCVSEAMSLFQVAPVKRRCWGLFREESFDYKRFVGLGLKGFWW